jgi:hypothetical protein
MLRKTNDLSTKRSERANQEKVLSTPSVEFELSDEELENTSGGVQTATPTTAVTAVTTTACMTLTIDGGGRAR